MCPHVLLQRSRQKGEPHPAFSFSHYELLNVSAATEAQNRQTCLGSLMLLVGARGRQIAHLQVKSVALDARGRQIAHIQLVKTAADQKSIQTVSLVK